MGEPGLCSLLCILQQQDRYDCQSPKRPKIPADARYSLVLKREAVTPFVSTLMLELRLYLLCLSRTCSGAQGLTGSSAWAFSPETQKEDKGHQEGHQGDAVAQVVDDDGNVVVHFALLLRQERESELRLLHTHTSAPH